MKRRLDETSPHPRATTTGLANITTVRSSAEINSVVPVGSVGGTGPAGTTTIVNVATSNLNISTSSGGGGSVNIVPGTQITTINSNNNQSIISGGVGGVGGVGGSSSHSVAATHHRIPTPQQQQQQQQQQTQHNTSTITYLPSAAIPHIPVTVSSSTKVNEVGSGNNNTTVCGNLTAATNANIVQVTPANGTGTGVGTGLPAQAIPTYSGAFVSRIPPNTLKAINVTENTVQIQTSSVSGSLSIIASAGIAQATHNNVIRQQQSTQNIATGPTVIQTQQQQQQQQPQHQTQQLSQLQLVNPQQQQQQVPQPQLIAQRKQLQVQQLQVAGPPPICAPIVMPPNGNPQRLKVEDALSYLDQVKFKYQDNPQIYNNFLDIMKEFKSHNIDTPGVIRRVSNLFEGHAELIEGFNMFLPPGYRIDVENNLPTVTMPSSSSLDRGPPPPPPSAGGNGALIGGNNSSASSTYGSSIQGNNNSSGGGNGSNSDNGSSSGPASSGGGTPSAANLGTNAITRAPDSNVSIPQAVHTIQVPVMSPSPAASYVSASPGPTSGANISVVPHFPQNYSKDRGDRDRTNLTQNQIISTSINNSLNAAATTCNGRITGNSTSTQNMLSVAPILPTSLLDLGSSAGRQNLNQIHEAAQLAGSGEASNQPHLKPVEFTHAITYVNKIKHRFQNQPAKYKAFLEILHKYQREQKCVKENSQGVVRCEQAVYNKVYDLFDNDKDLLYEFSQFLPEASSKIIDENSKQLSSSPRLSNSPQRLTNEAATLSRIESNTLSNLSTAATNVSSANLRPYNNANNADNATQQQNNLLSQLAATSSTSGSTIYDREYRQNMQPIRRNDIISALAYDKDNNRNNHHHTGFNPKYVSHNSTNMGLMSEQTQPQLHQQPHIYAGAGSKRAPSGFITSNQRSSGSLTSMPHNSNIISSTSGAESPASVNCQQQSLQVPSMRRNLDSTGFSDAGSGVPPKRFKSSSYRHIPQHEIDQKYTMGDAALFDKIHKMLGTGEVYDQFLRVLTLFNTQIVGRRDLRDLLHSFLGKEPEIWAEFCKFLEMNSRNNPNYETVMTLRTAQSQHSSNRQHNQYSNNIRDIDLNSCKRLLSYCALPNNEVCSTRTALCNEVLNDEWRSCPTWASEDASGANVRKQNFEDNIFRNIHRTEDERFELDMVIEVNREALRCLRAVEKNLSQMSHDNATKFKLNEKLNGTSSVNNVRAIQRIYGDKADDILQGLMQSPYIAVPLVVKRLKEKDEEWSAAQKNFNKAWREQFDKYYLKSLDHQSTIFKANDQKILRAKNLYNEIAILYTERRDQELVNGKPITGPHLELPYKKKCVLANAADLLIHHAKRQSSIQKQEKQLMKQVLRQFLPDIFQVPRQELSDDERDDDNDDRMDAADSSPSSSSASAKNAPLINTAANNSPNRYMVSPKQKQESVDISSSKNCATRETNAAAGTQLFPLPVGKSSESATTSTQSSLSATISTPDISPSSLSLSAFNTNTNIKDCKSVAAASVNTKSSSTTTSIKSENQSNASNFATSSSNTTQQHQLNEATPNAPHNIEVKQEMIDPIINQGPLPPHAVSQNENESYTLFMGGHRWYVFIRLHAILCDRLAKVMERAQKLLEDDKEENKPAANGDRRPISVSLGLRSENKVQVSDYYSYFLNLLKNWLDGNIDSNNFEDTMRELFGIYAYHTFTLDKVITYAVRQLHACVTENYSIECMEQFRKEQSQLATGGLCRTAAKRYDREQAYQRKVEEMLSQDSSYKFYIYNIDCRVTIELLETDSDEEDSKSPSQSTTKVKNWNRINLDRSVANTIINNTFENVADSPRHNSPIDNDNDDMKSEQMEYDVECPGGKRFLLRNKRNSQSLQQYLRLWQKEKQQRRSGAGGAAPTNSLTAHANVNVVEPQQQQQNSSSTGGLVASKSVTSCNKDNNNSSSSNNNSRSSSISSSTTKSNSASVSASAAAVDANTNTNANALSRGDSYDSLLLLKQYFYTETIPATYAKKDVPRQATNRYLRFVKSRCLGNAKLCHRTITEKKYKRFLNFHENWLKRNVNSQQQQCSDWLLGLGHGTTATATATLPPVNEHQQQQQHSNESRRRRTVMLTQSDLSRTPYRNYNRYKVITTEMPATITTAAATTTTTMMTAVTTATATATATPTAAITTIPLIAALSSSSSLPAQISASKLVISIPAASGGSGLTSIAIPATYAVGAAAGVNVPTLFTAAAATAAATSAIAITPILTTSTMSMSAFNATAISKQEISAHYHHLNSVAGVAAAANAAAAITANKKSSLTPTASASLAATLTSSATASASASASASSLTSTSTPPVVVVTTGNSGSGSSAAAELLRPVES